MLLMIMLFLSFTLIWGSTLTLLILTLRKHQHLQSQADALRGDIIEAGIAAEQKQTLDFSETSRQRDSDELNPASAEDN